VARDPEFLAQMDEAMVAERYARAFSPDGQ
jgi:hypothetical protein